MLRPQVEVRLDDAAARGALLEQRRTLRDEFPLSCKERLDISDARRCQDSMVGLDLPPDARGRTPAHC